MPVLPPSEVSEHAEYIARATRARHGLAASGAVGELEIAAGALGYLMRPGKGIAACSRRYTCMCLLYLDFVGRVTWTSFLGIF